MVTQTQKTQPPMLETTPQLQQAAKAIKTADTIMIGAGAGIGVDSGMPDFRGDQGFWKAYPKFKHLNKSFAEMANPRWFERQPDLAWGFYGHRLNLYRDTTPHKGFELLHQWMSAKPIPGFVFTSNVDGQFQKAGFSDEQILECHGSIHHWQCSQPCCASIWPAEPRRLEIDDVDMLCLSALPLCPHCGEVARPNILMFGDGNWLHQRTQAQQNRYQQFLQQVADKRLVVLEFGAGTAIPTVRYECEQAAWDESCLIRVNPREAHVPQGALSFACGALEFCRAIDSLL